MDTKKNGNGNGSGTKYDNAVARARGEGDASAAPTVPTVGGAALLITKVDDRVIAELQNDPSLEFAPQVKSLEEGEMIAGVLEGNGPQVDFVDKDTGVVRTVDTWIIASPDGGARISILSSAQLDRKLPPFIGGIVKIVRGKDLKTSSGYRCTDYLVAGPKRADGTKRTWATLPAASQQAALPAAGMTAPMAPNPPNPIDVQAHQDLT